MNINPININDHISWNQVKGEIFVIDTISGEYHTFNETGALIWRSIAKKKSFDHIVEEITSQYSINNQKAAEELEQFIGQLYHNGLLRKNNTHRGGGLNG